MLMVCPLGGAAGWSPMLRAFLLTTTYMTELHADSEDRPRETEHSPQLLTLNKKDQMHTMNQNSDHTHS
jgi:hypothetical protein